MDHVWILQRVEVFPYEGEETSLEGIFRTKKLATEREKLLLSKVKEDKKAYVEFEISAWYIHEAGCLFHEGRV